MKKEDIKRKKEKRDNLNDIEKEQMKKEDNKRKEKRDNLDDIEKEQLRKYKKEGEKVMRNNEK